MVQSAKAVRGMRAWVVSGVVLAAALVAGAAMGGAMDARAVAAGAAVAGPARAVDGDTLVLTLAGGPLRVRLHGIDAPELAQLCANAAGVHRPCGAEATAAMTGLIAGQNVRCVSQGNVSYDRLVAVCSAGDRDLGAAMVRQGQAWAARRYSVAYVGDEQDAEASGRGIWQGEATPPWAWRKGTRLAGTAGPACAIKGNVSNSGLIYHLPGSRGYARTKISAAKGERWFCTEADARAAGWRPSRG